MYVQNQVSKHHNLHCGVHREQAGVQPQHHRQQQEVPKGPMPLQRPLDRNGKAIEVAGRGRRHCNLRNDRGWADGMHNSCFR